MLSQSSIVIYQGGILQFAGLFAQIDYSQDAQWHDWNQDALKRFINNMDPQQSVKKSMAPIDSYSQGRTTELNYEPFKEPWWPDNTNPAKASTPLFMEENQKSLSFDEGYDE